MSDFEDPKLEKARRAGADATEAEKEHLSNAGRKGAAITNEIKAYKKVELAKLQQELEIELQYAEILHQEGEEAAQQWLKEIKSNQ
jgi:general stress protein YciG